MDEKQTVVPNSRGVVTRREARPAREAVHIQIDVHAQKIAAYAFRDFRSLRTIEIPIAVRGIGKGAFKGCVSLERILIPSGSHLSYIDADAFSGCRALREIHFPSRLHNIGSHAFQNCSSLRKMSMGQAVDEISAFAFSDVPVFKAFFDAILNGEHSANVLRVFRSLSCGVPNSYSLRSIAFSWPKRSLDRLSPSQVRDWPMSDFVMLLDLLAAMPFYATSDPKSPVGHVEKVLLRFMGEDVLPRDKRAMIVRHLMIEHKWPVWRDTLNSVDRQWDQERAWNWKLLPSAFCDNENFRDWLEKQNRAAWWNLKMGVRLEGMAEKMSQCAEKDEWAQFLVMAGVCGEEIASQVFCYLVKDRNADAVAGVVRASAKSEMQLPLNDLAFECMNWDVEDAVKILKAIEEVSPGLCASLYDSYGRGLLWYSLYVRENGYLPFSRQNALAQFLISIGCDPARENVNGLAWQDMVEA